MSSSAFFRFAVILTINVKTDYRGQIVLGSEEFRERVREESIRIDREHPRYERTAIRPSVDHVLRVLAKTYGLKLDDLLRGGEGKTTSREESVCNW